MNREELEVLLRTTMREEIFAHAPSMLPPPVDADSEREVIAALLDGLAFPKWFPRLRANHFFHPLHEMTYELALNEYREVKLDLEALAAHLSDNEVHEAMTWIEVARDCVPWRGRPMTEVAAMRVTEMYRRRKLIEILDQQCASLRAGATDSGTVMVRLRECTGIDNGKRKG